MFGCEETDEQQYKYEFRKDFNPLCPYYVAGLTSSVKSVNCCLEIETSCYCIAFILHELDTVAASDTTGWSLCFHTPKCGICG